MEIYKFMKVYLFVTFFAVMLRLRISIYIIIIKYSMINDIQTIKIFRKILISHSLSKTIHLLIKFFLKLIIKLVIGHSNIKLNKNAHAKVKTTTPGI